MYKTLNCMRQLTQKEEEVMTILWQLQKAFVNDILNEMEEPKPPYNTVSSIVRKLESEGLVGFEAFGKTHRYFPILKKEDYRVGVMDRVLSHFFDDSPSALLSYFMKKEKVDDGELQKLLEEVRRREEKGGE
jgi:BlaI family penicillinase repressor